MFFSWPPPSWLVRYWQWPFKSWFLGRSVKNGKLLKYWVWNTLVGPLVIIIWRLLDVRWPFMYSYVQMSVIGLMAMHVLGGYHRLVNLLWSTGKLKVFPARWSPWRPLYCGPTGPLRTQVLMVAVLSLFFKGPILVYTSYGLVSRFSTHFRAWGDSMVLLWPSPRQPFSEF